MKSTILSLCLWFVGAFAAHAQTTPPAGATATPPVAYISVAPQPVYAERSYVARIQSPQIVALNARVTGYLQAQDFKDGDTVTEGQLLYVIEQPPYQAAVAQAQAAVEQAQAQSHNANLTLGRAQALLNTPAGLPSSVDASRAAATSGAAQIASAQAQLQTAQINLGYTEIRSPIAGRISATNVDVGNVVGPSTGPLATVVSEDPVYVVFSVPVPDALKLRDEAASGGFGAVVVLVTLPDGSTYGHTASIDFVNNQITPSTDTLTLRATIANPPIAGMNSADTGQRELQDGEFVNVVLRDRQPQQQITVPQQAVIADQLGSYVLVIGPNNIAQRRDVTTGQTTPQSVAILTGLNPGDHVVVEGVQRVHPGAKVSAQPAKNRPLPANGQE